MSEKMQLEYEVSVTGLGEAAVTAENASKSAEQASAAMGNAKAQSIGALPVMLMSVRAMNAARLAVEQTSKAITDLDPTAAMYGFLNMMQTVRNLTSLMKMLKDSTGAASAAQAILATLTGRWWLIPLAIAAGALIYAKIKSMQTGGLVKETGPYLLHRGEYVVPAERVVERMVPVPVEHVTERTAAPPFTPPRNIRYGPIFITFNRQPREGLDVDGWLRELGPRIVEQTRRGA